MAIIGLPTLPSPILVPDNPDDVLPPGYVVDGILPGVTNPDGSIIVDEFDISVTGECVDYTDTCTEYWCLDDGCPPGCVPDTSDDPYPPGQPAVQSCQVTEYSTGLYDKHGRTCLKEINGRFWMGQESSIDILILEKDGTLFKRVYRPALAGVIEGSRFGQHFVQFLDKVIFWSESRLETTFEDIFYVYDLDGNYLEYWQLPDEYNLNINGNVASSMVDANDDFFIVAAYQCYNPVSARHNTFFWFDYYGTCFKIVEQPGSDDAFSIRLMGDKLFCGNYFSKVEANLDYCGTVVMRSATDASFITRLDRGKTPEKFDYWGSALKLITYKDGSQLMGVGIGYEETGTNANLPETQKMSLFNSTGIVDRVLDNAGSAYPLDWDVGTANNNIFYENGFHVFGDYMIVGAGRMNNPYSTTTSDAAGHVFITDLYGNIISEIGNFLPAAGRDHQLGFAVWMDKDYVYMFGGYNAYTKYIKRCAISWAI